MTVVFIAALYPVHCEAAWLFTTKEPYVAKVGTEVITVKEFLAQVGRLHTTGRVGEALEKSEDRAFPQEDYRRFLNELIDNRLMAQEAVNLEFDKEASFISESGNFALNLYLERLRKEEILDKIKVADAEIESFYEQRIKNKEAVPTAEEKKHGDTRKEGVDVKEEALGKEAVAEGKPPVMTAGERRGIRNVIYEEKVKAGEEAYFAKLLARADVEVDENAFKELSRSRPDLMGSPVAYVEGEPVYGIEVLQIMRKGAPEAQKKYALDRVVIHKLLDREALSRGYDRKDPELGDRIRRYNEKLLIDLFKRLAVSPVVKVKEKDVSAYYEANKESFRFPDKVNLRMIAAEDPDSAHAILEKLKKGSDFAYLAAEESIDPSSNRGGDIGWVSSDNLPQEVRDALKGAQEGAVVGPFNLRRAYVIYELRGIEKGSIMPLDDVRGDIDLMLGRIIFEDKLAEYMRRLKEIVKVEINEEEFGKFAGR